MTEQDVALAIAILKMTPDQRNAAICKDYTDGMSSYDIEQKYQISRQWVHKILTRAGIDLRPPSEVRVNRDTFLGVNISEEAKDGVTEIAQKRGTSVSAVADQALQEFIDKEKNA